MAPCSLHPNDAYTVGWISALPIEMAAAKGMLDEEHGDPQTPPQQADDNNYLLGRVGKHNVVVACLPKDEIGSSSAAVVARDMLFTFPNIRVGLLVGIGAGIPNYDRDDEKDVRLGDVVISSDKRNGGVVVYDFGKRLGDGSFEAVYALDRPPRSLRTALARLEMEHEMRENRIPQYLEAMLEKYPRLKNKGFLCPGQPKDLLFHADYQHQGGKSCETCDREKVTRREPEVRLDTNPVIHYGIVATGSSVVKHAPTREEIRQRHKAICLEMEAAGLMNNFPCLVIRGISDYADSHKNDQWQPYAAATAAACAKELLEYIQPRDVDETRAAKDVLNQVSESLLRIEDHSATTRGLILTNQEDQFRAKVIFWISSLDFAAKYRDSIGRRQIGTGLWLLDSAAFQAWLTGLHQTMFCPGMPGAGKTIMASIVIDHLLSTFPDTDVAVAYFYCAYKEQHEGKDLVAALLRQLVQQLPALPEAVNDLYMRHHQRRTLPTRHELSEVLRSVASGFSQVFLVVDALDECWEENNTRAEFLHSIKEVKLFANTLVTSRPIPAIERVFEQEPKQEIRASDGDVRAYVEAKIETELNHVSAKPSLQTEIVDKVAAKAKGMFLLAKLHVDSLANKPSIRDLREALDVLPEGIDDTYNTAMERVLSQSPDNVRLAKRVLSWFVYALRPLAVQELQHALAVRIGDVNLNEEALPFVGHLLSVCAGLVTIDTESNIIRLVHYTTQEYFERTRREHLPDGPISVASACLTYLSFDAFAEGHCKGDHELLSRLAQYPLLSYSAQYWGNHACGDHERLVVGLALDVLEHKPKLASAIQVVDSLRLGPPGYGQHFRKNITGLHIAASFGLINTSCLLLDNGADVNAQGGNYGSALYVASSKGHETIVQLLLNKGADVNAQGRNYGSALQVASSEGYETIVQLLLNKGADVNARGGNYGSALLAASCKDHETIVQLLLNKGADVNAQGRRYGNALQAASSMGHEKTVQLLLDEGADVNAQGGRFGNALQAALFIGHETTMQLLLDKGADFNAQGGAYGNALSVASFQGDEKIVQLLLNEGADVNAQGGRYGNALQAASSMGHETTVQLLLDKGADVNAQGGCHGNALYAASSKGHETIVQLLLDKGAAW
ncbi:hypothetical protein B0A49_00656 [Cryomyces minteri]|uniref:Uncharacterized protein n=1 Tax=Cryomyces minteri TaxID=331657 RepID=A0A4U0XX42_9PEZI|nr:hypothetical protein B0A49_00656 [Cryomyces minteri]